MKLTIKKSVANEILETLNTKKRTLMNKAFSHKYLRKIPKKNGKGWYYIYSETFLKPFRALWEMFGLTSEKISEDYEKYNINADYGVDKKGFASHVLEYFSNKIKWDTFFSKKEEREKHQKPIKIDENVNIHRNGTAANVAEKDKPTDNKIKINRSLMRKVFSIYNRSGEKQNEQTDNVGAGSGELQTDDKAVRRTGRTGLGDFNVSGGGHGDDRSSPVQPVIDDGRRTGRNARLTKTATINIREACLKLLEEKTDSEMTDADKELLRQYEGAGGLGEDSATTHGTLYEYYTPEKVVKKVWDLVEKYTGPGTKTVLEPAAGIGRFAGNKDDTFTLCEIDKTSARISKILHPAAEVKQGAFQELFMSGGISKKEYNGKKYDVVIGNPPYGKYEGLYKGQGEGKEHARYEEYFIDRGLDALREGGILSFVVPSSFLRGKSSIIKDKIAKKARLLEAWRLPNGTFNTTGVGTDIIILRKEKGEPSDFSENNYFEKNPQMIVGDETIRNGKFGEEKYVKPKDGETFDQAIERIKVDAVEAVLVGEQTDSEKMKEVIETKVEAVKTASDVSRPSRILSLLIPFSQLTVTRNNPESYANEIERLNASVKKIPKLYDNEGLKKHPVALHYFSGNTDFYVSEWDGKDTFFGYTILNGDRENAEWGYMSLSQIMSIPEMNLDYHQTPGMIEDIVTQKFSATTNEEVQSKAESTQNRSNAMKGNQNAKKDGTKQPEKSAEKNPADTDTLDSFNKKYNRSIPAESLPIWKATTWDGKINTSQLSDKEKIYIEKSGNYIADKDGNLFNKINFASGNIYAKLEQLESDKEVLGEKEYNQQKEILYQALPPIRKIGDFSVSPISDFAKSITFKNDEGQILGDLRDMFIAWAKNGNYRFDADDSPVSSLEIGSKITFSDIEDYIYQRPVIAERSFDAADRETNKMIADQTRELRKDAAERIFNRFIMEGVSESDKQRIGIEYNKKYNAVVNPDYTKIPIFIDGIAKTHHGKPLEIKDQQLKGVSFACNKGNGVIAYDVGVGKTMVGIMATVSQLQSGRAKKPLVCVPKAVYKNWVKTIKNLFPAISINELGNLNKKYTGKNFEVSEGTISVCTYEALQNITFKQETIEGDLLNDILESQVTESEDKTKRQGDIEREKIMTMLGVATKTNKALSDGAVYWEDLGIDHITVDEVHNFKNVFAIAKPTHGGSSTDRKTSSRLANEFQGIGGSQSARGLKMFALTQLIQKENNDRNVFALSATPFTNSPIEIYNILSLVARKKLKDAGIYNLHEFMAQFAELKTDWVYKANGEITRSQVMKNFKNLTALQSLITEYIDKVDGEEAGVLRPKKITHISEIRPTALQKQIIEVETKRMTETAKDDKGAMLVAINNMRMAMLSPALVKGGGLYEEAGIQLPKADEIVTSSPKLTFTCDSVVKAYQNNPKNSQIIYMPRGVEEYPFVKQYLAERGIPADAIAFMNAKTSLDAKEKIKSDFNNVDGTVKVIIGSETIKEGVSLNGNTTTLYNTFLGWNPTESIQVEGRIHRQGNKQGHTHIIYPLMNDSVDSVMYQKHDEKSSRLNDLYSYKGDKLNVEDVDPEELKFALIKNPEKRAKFKIDMLAEEIEAKRSTLQAQMDILFKNSTQLKELESSQRVLLNMEKKEAESKSAYEALKQEIDKRKKELKKELKKEGFGSDWHLQQKVDSAAYNLMSENEALKKYKKEVKSAQNKAAVINEKFEKMGIKTNDDVDKKMSEMTEEIAYLENQISGIRNDREKYIQEAKLQIAAETKDIPPLDKLVDANVKSIITNLRPMKEVEQEILVEKKMKKSIRVLRCKVA